MEKKRNQKGFTLAELLIVVAIIAVLVAIAIPVFTTQLEKSREATDVANVRSAYADIMAEYITNADQGYSMSVTAKQTQDNWQMGADKAVLMTQVDGKESSVSIPVRKSPGGNYIVKIENSGGTAKVTVE